MVLGVDVGRWKVYLALVEHHQDKLYVVKLDSPLIESVEKSLEALLKEYGPYEIRVEVPSKRPFAKGMTQKDAQVLRNAMGRVKSWGINMRLPTYGLKSVRPEAWRPGFHEAPGWRQVLTGLRLPSETDVYRTLVKMQREGKLEGHVPAKNLNLVDAIGMATLSREELMRTEPEIVHEPESLWEPGLVEKEGAA